MLRNIAQTAFILVNTIISFLVIRCEAFEREADPEDRLTGERRGSSVAAPIRKTPEQHQAWDRGLERPSAAKDERASSSFSPSPSAWSIASKSSL